MGNTDGEVVGEMKTSTKTDNLDPEWDGESFNFSCEEDHFTEFTLKFQVMDTGLGPDVELGEAVVPVKLIPLEDPVEYTFSLGIKKGKTSLGTITVTAAVTPKAGFFG